MKTGTVTGTVEDRVTVLETEFRTELRHLATKADLAELRWQILGALIAVATLAVLAVKYLPDGRVLIEEGRDGHKANP